VATAGLRGVLAFEEPERADPRTLRDFDSYAYSVAVSPDGKRLATGDWSQRVRIWDRLSGAPLLTVQLGPSPRPVQSLAWSPDGKRLLACVVTDALEQNCHVLDTQTGERLASTPGGTIAFTGAWLDNERFVGACDERIEIRRAKDASLERAVELVPLDSTTMPWSMRWDIALSPDRSRLALACPDGGVRRWKLPEFEPLPVIRAHEGSAHSVAWSADGTKLITAGSDRRIRVRDASSGALLHETTGHASAIFDLCLSPDGSRLFSGSDDDTIRVWSTSTWSELARLDGHSDYVFALDCAPDGQLLSASGDRTVRMWDTRTRAQVLRELSRR
jgi:WD40 repeat protein